MCVDRENARLDEPSVALKNLLAKITLSPELARRSQAAGRAGYLIDLMRREREDHELALRPLDRYLRGLAELAGVRLEEVRHGLGATAWDVVTAGTAPLLARISRLIGLSAAETAACARWAYLGAVMPDSSDALLATHRGKLASTLEKELQRHEAEYANEQRVELDRILEAIRSEYGEA
jgi:hypothetical protein